MRTLDSIIAATSDALRPLLEEAFEAGRSVGREEAALDLRARIDGILSIAPPPALKVNALVSSTKRAGSGSVKPTIAEMIEKAPNGLTAGDIHTATNFKPNSIRGTLWTLGNEGLTVKRNGRWYWKARSSSPQGEAGALGAPARH